MFVEEIRSPPLSGRPSSTDRGDKRRAAEGAIRGG
jgi:hypothetical protein